jgi:hypothetical protein
MNRRIHAGLTVAAIFSCASFCCASALADETVSRATPTHHQSLQECIEKQKTADVTQSKAAMRRICKDQLKREKQLGESDPPPSDSARSP